MQNIQYAQPQSIGASRGHAIILNINKSQKSPIAAATATRSGRG